MKKLTFLLIIALSYFSIQAQNQAPIVTTLVTPVSTCYDTIKTYFKVADSESDECTLSVEYSLDNGSNWFAAKIVDSVFNTNPINNDTLLWLSYGDLGIKKHESVMLKITPFDSDIGLSDSTGQFIVDNFSNFDFTQYYPNASILDIDFKVDSVISGSTKVIADFKTFGTNNCSLSFELNFTNAEGWSGTSNDMSKWLNSSVSDTFTWITANLGSLDYDNLDLRILAFDTLTKRYSPPLSINNLSIDNRSPELLWSGAYTDSNIINLQFEDDIDPAQIMDTSRYSLNFGRKVVRLQQQFRRNSEIAISYYAKAGPESPDAGEDVLVQYLTNTNSWVTVGTIPYSNSTWQAYNHTITNTNAFHSGFKFRFIQGRNSGNGMDNFHIDDIQITSNGISLFVENVNLSTISTSNWSSYTSFVTTSSTVYNSYPYSLKTEGSGSRELVSRVINTNNIGTNNGTTNWIAYTDASLIGSVNYVLSIDTLFDRAGNFSVNVTDGFICQETLLKPIITFDQDDIVLSGNSAAIPITISGVSGDSCNINAVKFKAYGSNWLDATITNNLTNIANGKDTIIWNTISDFPDIDMLDAHLMLSLSNTSSDTGIFYIKEGIKIDNNVAPEVTITQTSTKYSDTVTLNYSVKNAENPSVGLKVYYSNNSTDWLPADIIGETYAVSTTNLTGTFKWAAKEDVLKLHPYDVSGQFKLKVIPFDNHEQGTEVIVPIDINTSTIPIISLTDLVGEQSDTVKIDYTIFDIDNSNIDLICKYSVDKITWHNATMSSNLSGLTPSEYSGTLSWLSAIDLSKSDNSNVYFMVTPYDPSIGMSDIVKPFHLDNNAEPNVILAPFTGATQFDNVDIDFTLSDIEFDTLGLLFEYKTINDTGWRKASIIDSSIVYDSSLYTANLINTVTWLGLSDVPNYAGTVIFRALAYDIDSSVYDTASFYYSNKRPFLSINNIPSESSDDVPVSYKIQSNSADSVTIMTWFTDSGGIFDTATVIGSTKLSPYDTSGVLTWKSLDDIGYKEVKNQRIRMEAITHSSSTGNSVAYSNYFELDNNRVPLTKIVDFREEVDGNVSFRISLSDNESDSLGVHLKYQIDSTSEWQDGTIIIPIGKMSPDYYAGDSITVIWNASKDLPNASDSILVKIASFDNDTGFYDSIALFINQTAPILTIHSLNNSEYNGDIPIPFTMSYSGKDSVSFICTYSINGGATWDTSTILNPTKYSGQNVSDTVFWMSNTDIPGIDKSYTLFRILPISKLNSNWVASNGFHVDNNMVPSTHILSYQKEIGGNISFNVSLSDNERDSLGVHLMYKIDSVSGWQNGGLLNPTGKIASDNYDGDTISVVWNSSKDLFNISDSVLVKIAAFDNDTGIYDSTKLFINQKFPVLTIDSLTLSEYCDTIPVSFTLSYLGIDSVSFICMHSKDDGINWDTSSVFNLEKYSGALVSDTLLWLSDIDMAGEDISNVKFKILPVSKLMGTWSFSNPFHVDNNSIPTVKLLSPAVVTVDKVFLTSIFSDQESDDLGFKVEYLLHDSANWISATIDSPISPIDSNMYTSDTLLIAWNYLTDISNYSDSITIRINAFDNDSSVWDSLTFFLGQQFPHVMIDSLVNTEYSDTIPIAFTLSYDNFDTVNISIEYSSDSGATWQSATLDTNPPLFGNAIDTLLWISSIDEPGKDFYNLQLRIKPFSNFEGLWSYSNLFHLDNNAAPKLSFMPDLKLLNNSIVPLNTILEFNVEDDELDSVSLVCILVTPFDTINLLPNSDINKISFNEYQNREIEINYAPKEYGDSIAAQFIIYGIDSDTGFSDTLSLKYRNFLGDYNQNGYVDLQDLDSFSLAWYNDDFSKNTGPIEGEYPNIKVIQDSLFNLEDLSSFLVSWNLSRKSYVDTTDTSALDDITSSRYINEDEKVFDSFASTELDPSGVVIQKVSKDVYDIFVSINDFDIISGGFLFKFSKNISLLDWAKLDGDITLDAYNSRSSKLLLYSGNFLQHVQSKDVKVRVKIDNKKEDAILNLLCHGYNLTESIDKTIRINIIENEKDNINVSISPNPFILNTPLPSSLSANYTNGIGTLLLVVDDNLKHNDITIQSGTVKIFDLLGNVVLPETDLSWGINGDAFYLWDGRNKNDRLVASGRYEAYINLRLNNGSIQTFKKSILVKQEN